MKRPENADPHLAWPVTEDPASILHPLQRAANIHGRWPSCLFCDERAVILNGNVPRCMQHGARWLHAVCARLPIDSARRWLIIYGYAPRIKPATTQGGKLNP